MAASSRRQVAEGIRRSLFLVSALTLTTAIAVAEVRVMHEQQVLPLDPVAEIHATAIDENVIVLGAPEDASLGPESGAVYVFERPEGGRLGAGRMAARPGRGPLSSLRALGGC